MFCKPFKLMLYILFSIAIVTGCALSPQRSAMVTMPTDEIWDLVVIGDSSIDRIGEAFASQIENDVGVMVVVEDYVADGLRIGDVISVLQHKGAFRDELRDLPTDLADADVVVMFIGNPIGSIISENPWNMDGCGHVSALPKNCNPAALEKYITDLKWIWGEIFRLRNGQQTILRTMDMYNPIVNIWNEKDIFLECTRCLENHSNAIRLAAEAYHIPFISRYDVYNGVNHDEDSRERGYIRSVGFHVSNLGIQVLIEMLAQLGYEPVPPP